MRTAHMQRTNVLPGFLFNHFGNILVFYMYSTCKILCMSYSLFSIHFLPFLMETCLLYLDDKLWIFLAWNASYALFVFYGDFLKSFIILVTIIIKRGERYSRNVNIWYCKAGKNFKIIKKLITLHLYRPISPFLMHSMIKMFSVY